MKTTSLSASLSTNLGASLSANLSTSLGANPGGNRSTKLSGNLGAEIDPGAILDPESLLLMKASAAANGCRSTSYEDTPPASLAASHPLDLGVYDEQV